VQRGGSAAHRGSATPAGNGWVLTEGDSFVVSLERLITIPSSPDKLRFEYSGLSFDTSDGNSIKDAFEVALVDPTTGVPLTPTVAGGRDAYFNRTEDVDAPQAQGVTDTHATSDSGVVSVEIDDLTPGSSAKVILRLVNNDDDRETTVRIGDATEAASVSISGAGAVNEGTVHAQPGLERLPERRRARRLGDQLGRRDSDADCYRKPRFRPAHLRRGTIVGVDYSYGDRRQHDLHLEHADGICEQRCAYGNTHEQWSRQRGCSSHRDFLSSTGPVGDRYRGRIPVQLGDQRRRLGDHLRGRIHVDVGKLHVHPERHANGFRPHFR
jgi:hypothetical protein